MNMASAQFSVGALPSQRTLVFAAVALFCLHAAAEIPRNTEQSESGALPLPRWTEQELTAFQQSLHSANGPGILLPEAGGQVTDIHELLNTPIPSGPRLDHLFNAQDGELSPRLRPENMRLFLPESILGLPTQGQVNNERMPTPLSSLKQVTAEFLATCEQALPTDYLIDPDLLVPEMPHHDMERFLEFHARDARIKLHVLIIPHDCKLPGGAELEKIASGSLLQTEACLLVYPLAEPWRARLFVSQTVHDQTSAEFLTETVQACLREALQSSDSHDQLHRYAVHLSTRLFWLQKALGVAAGNVAAEAQTLAEISLETANQPAPNAISILAIVLWCMAGGLMILITGIAIRSFQIYRRLRRQNRVWILPEPETVPRLGGAFTGGGGGMMRYS
jgi:hypothetical protein